MKYSKKQRRDAFERVHAVREGMYYQEKEGDGIGLYVSPDDMQAHRLFNIAWIAWNEALDFAESGTPVPIPADHVNSSGG